MFIYTSPIVSRYYSTDYGTPTPTERIRLQAWAGPARGGARAGSVKFIFISKENYLRFCIYIGLIYRFRVYTALPKGRFNLHIPSGARREDSLGLK